MTDSPTTHQSPAPGDVVLVTPPIQVVTVDSVHAGGFYGAAGPDGVKRFVRASTPIAVLLTAEQRDSSAARAEIARLTAELADALDRVVELTTQADESAARAFKLRVEYKNLESANAALHADNSAVHADRDMYQAHLERAVGERDQLAAQIGQIGSIINPPATPATPFS